MTRSSSPSGDVKGVASSRSAREGRILQIADQCRRGQNPFIASVLSRQGHGLLLAKISTDRGAESNLLDEVDLKLTTTKNLQEDRQPLDLVPSQAGISDDRPPTQSNERDESLAGMKELSNPICRHVNFSQYETSHATGEPLSYQFPRSPHFKSREFLYNREWLQAERPQLDGSATTQGLQTTGSAGQQIPELCDKVITKSASCGESHLDEETPSVKPTTDSSELTANTDTDLRKAQADLIQAVTDLSSYPKASDDLAISLPMDEPHGEARAETPGALTMVEATHESLPSQSSEASVGIDAMLPDKTRDELHSASNIKSNTLISTPRATAPSSKFRLDSPLVYSPSQHLFSELEGMQDIQQYLNQTKFDMKAEAQKLLEAELIS